MAGEGRCLIQGEERERKGREGKSEKRGESERGGRGGGREADEVEVYAWSPDIFSWRRH
jgi:hypothetical protein